MKFELIYDFHTFAFMNFFLIDILTSSICFSDNVQTELCWTCGM